MENWQSNEPNSYDYSNPKSQSMPGGIYPMPKTQGKRRTLGKCLLVGAGIVTLAAVLFLPGSLLVSALSDQLVAWRTARALKADGMVVTTTFEEKLFFLSPYLPESYEDSTEAAITITNLKNTSLTYTGTKVSDGGENDGYYCYVLTEGTYLVELVWPNGVTASAILPVGEQSLYEIHFNHI